MWVLHERKQARKRLGVAVAKEPARSADGDGPNGHSERHRTALEEGLVRHVQLRGSAPELPQEEPQRGIVVRARAKPPKRALCLLPRARHVELVPLRQGEGRGGKRADPGKPLRRLGKRKKAQPAVVRLGVCADPRQDGLLGDPSQFLETISVEGGEIT